MKRILVVDDDPFTCKLVLQALEKDYKVVVTGTGKSALNILAEEDFHMIILDVIMPDLDGWDVLRYIRKEQRTALTPVIYLTGRDREEDRIHGLRLGADDFLIKPFATTELQLRVARILERAGKLHRLQEGGGGFQGSLSDFGLAPLLTLLSMETKTGHLHIERGSKQFTLFLRLGQVVCARTDGSEATSYETVYDALSEPGGSFHFVSRQVLDDNEIGQTTSQLLLEVAQEMDEGRSEGSKADDGP